MEFNVSEIMKRVASSIEEELKLAETEDDIRDNKSYFSLNDKEYRVKKLNYKEQEEVKKFNAIKHKELLEERDVQGKRVYFYKDEWIEMLKGIKGKDIEVWDANIKAKAEELAAMQMSTTEELDENIKKQKKQKIELLWTEYMQMCMSREEILKDSIETTLDEQKESFIFIKALEVKENDVWVKAFKTYNELEQSEDYVLINTGLRKLNKLV